MESSALHFITDENWQRIIFHLNHSFVTMKTISLKTIMLFLLAGSFAFASCEKDEDTKGNKTDMLTEKNWKMVALTSDPAIDWDGNGTLVTNVFNQFDACEKDDFTIFKKNGIVAFDEGPTKCATEDPQTTTGLWAFNTDETVLSVTENGETTSWKILELTNSTLKIEYIIDFGTKYSLTATFKR